jgi:hypothetical protein
MASLLELQLSFAAALHDPGAGCAVRPAANLDVYRNNARHQFRKALAISFPVLLRRVGDDYFRQLCFHYRQRFPSRSGDLHWVGREFAGFLDEHLGGGEYGWLADLARLEWAHGQAAVMDPLPALGVEVLTRFAPEELERLVFQLQPSLSLQTSPFPVFSVWQANQEENAPPVDQSAGSERFMILSRPDVVEVARVSSSLFSYLSALARGIQLAQAADDAGLDEAGLLQALRFMFRESLVCGVDVASAEAQSSKR